MNYLLQEKTLRDHEPHSMGFAVNVSWDIARWGRTSRTSSANFTFRRLERVTSLGCAVPARRFDCGFGQRSREGRCHDRGSPGSYSGSRVIPTGRFRVTRRPVTGDAVGAGRPPPRPGTPTARQIRYPSGCTWWGYVDLNHGPRPYQGRALTD